MSPPATPLDPPPDSAESLALLERRLARERQARKAAEDLLNGKSLELFAALNNASDSRRQLELALWASGESIWEWQAATDTGEVRSFTEVQGNPVVVGFSVAESIQHVHPDDQEFFLLKWRVHMAGGDEALDLSLRFLLDGKWHWLRLRGQAVVRGPDGMAERMVGTVKDITRHREAENSLRLMASAFASSRDALLVMTEQWQIIEANQAFQALLAQPSNKLTGRHFGQFADLPTPFFRALQDHGFADAETELVDGGYRRIPIEIRINRFAAQGTSAPYLIATLRDITERRQAATALERMARLDPVTQLPNRRAMQEELDLRLHAHTSPPPLAVLFIDLDGFKGVNDTLGHQAGDDLLRVVAGRLQSQLEQKDFLARWGGDEFVVLANQPHPLGEADQIAQRLLQVLRQPISVGEHRVGIGASIGIALSPDDGNDAQTLLRHADAAMYAAKRSGRDRAERYHAGLDSDGLQRITLTGLLRQAVERQALTFVAQPKVCADGTPVGCELLVRWTTTEFGPVSPASFIPLAEETGLILPIGHQAIREAAQLVARLDAQGTPLSVAVNLSPLQLRDPQLQQVLADACRHEGVSPARIQLEITESAFLDNKQDTLRLLDLFREQGFKLALDDFGTGYSSLSYLRDLPFDVVKIDRAFLRDVDRDARSARLLAGIVDLCHALQMQLVAEGVETRSQLEVLDALGIVEYQGFYFHKPLAQADFLLLAAQKR